LTFEENSESVYKYCIDFQFSCRKHFDLSSVSGVRVRKKRTLRKRSGIKQKMGRQKCAISGCPGNSMLGIHLFRFPQEHNRFTILYFI